MIYMRPSTVTVMSISRSTVHGFLCAVLCSSSVRAGHGLQPPEHYSTSTSTSSAGQAMARALGADAMTAARPKGSSHTQPMLAGGRVWPREEKGRDAGEGDVCWSRE